MDIKSLILEYAPEEHYMIKGKQVTVRRDDLAYLPPLPPNSKMSAMFELVKHAYVLGYKEVTMFAKKQQGTSYVIGLPVFCEMFGMQCSITYPLSKKQQAPDWIHNMLEKHRNTIIEYLHPNMVTINLNQTKLFAEKRGSFFMPMGFDHELGVRAHTHKFALPQHIGTLVLSVMTGIVLAGTLKQIYQRKYNVENMIAISCGRPVESVYKSMNKYIVDLYESQHLDYLNIYNPYERNFDAIKAIKKFHLLPGEELPFPMHPDYEAKAWYWICENAPYLKEPIYFINVGR